MSASAQVHAVSCVYVYFVCWLSLFYSSVILLWLVVTNKDAYGIIIIIIKQYFCV